MLILFENYSNNIKAIADMMRNKKNRGVQEKYCKILYYIHKRRNDLNWKIKN